jgi:signal transduction histidine kinase
MQREMDKRMKSTDHKEPIELLLVISGQPDFHEQVQKELGRRQNRLCVTDASSFEGARRAIEARSPAVILLEESALASGAIAQEGRKPTLWAAATSLAECAPVIVVGSAEHQAELTELLAAGDADYVIGSESCLAVAIGLVERRLRQRLLRINREAASQNEPASEIGSQQEMRDFGEVLRHELNNPLTGILGNAELLLVELRRRNIELPRQAESRLETIATLAVRMRETVRRLSEEWEAQSESAAEELEHHPN